jgi:endogenous inhibitor of DNA gyrase (YacG/DUF329 family)
MVTASGSKHPEWSRHLMTKTATCPICGDPMDRAYRPFCSRRCADVDLHRWLSEGYRVEGPEDDSEGVRDDGPAER